MRPPRMPDPEDDQYIDEVLPAYPDGQYGQAH
jgi:hypothetical protein